jgi:hypothetical protein
MRWSNRTPILPRIRACLKSRAKARALYNRSGQRLGSSPPACVLSCRWPGVRRAVSGRPWPSPARWILLVRPPRLRPSASPATGSAPPFCRFSAAWPACGGLRRRAGGRGRWCYPRRHAPSPTRLPHPLAPGGPGGRAPRCRPAATGSSDRCRCRAADIARAGLARGRRCASPRGCRKSPGAGLFQG